MGLSQLHPFLGSLSVAFRVLTHYRASTCDGGKSQRGVTRLSRLRSAVRSMDEGLRRFAKQSKVFYPLGKVANIAVIDEFDCA
jgi:hypothetical protein